MSHFPYFLYDYIPKVSNTSCFFIFPRTSVWFYTCFSNWSWFFFPLSLRLVYDLCITLYYLNNSMSYFPYFLYNYIPQVSNTSCCFSFSKNICMILHLLFQLIVIFFSCPHNVSPQLMYNLCISLYQFCNFMSYFP